MCSCNPSSSCAYLNWRRCKNICIYFIHSNNANYSNFFISHFPLLTSSSFFYITELSWTKKFSCRKPLPVTRSFFCFPSQFWDTHEYFHWKKKITKVKLNIWKYLYTNLPNCMTALGIWHYLGVLMHGNVAAKISRGPCGLLESMLYALSFKAV